MTDLIITERAYNENNIQYIQTTLSELLGNTGCVVTRSETSGRVILKVSCPEEFVKVVKAEIADRAAEIIAVRYKYELFKKVITVTGLSALETEILYASLIAADFDDDKKFAYKKFSSLNQFAIDGVYHFRLQKLKLKWLDISEYMPRVFINVQLKEFIVFMLEDKKKRVYIDDGKVYDAHYRLLKRSDLLDGEGVKIIREVLLSGGGEVELTGCVSKDDEFYLKEFFGDKIFFSAGNLS